MNEYEISLTATAQADIRALGGKMQSRILNKLEWMGANATHIHHQSLEGQQWGGLLKYRVGNYRIIYQLDADNQQLTILKVGHRRDVYKR